MKAFGIGLLGFGTVGAGVVEVLQRNGDLVADRMGLKLEIRAIADLDLDSDRGVEVDRSILTTDAKAVVEDDRVDVVVELIGGISPAKDLILRALELGKPVVTANKALLAEHGEEIFSTAKAHEADIFFEASVGGGIPIIRSLREGLIANHVESIYGILNGTCNYILTEMERAGRPFADVLADAQAAGYAEAEPSLDIDGIDTAHKAVILASLAYGFNVPMSAASVRGIRNVATFDIGYAEELGYRIKLLAIIKQVDGEVQVCVHPTLVPLDSTLASVSGTFNAVMVRGDIVGDTLYYGRGAGREPTASAVVSDIADAARNLAFESEQRVPGFVPHEHYGKIMPVEKTRARYYLRLSLLDEPGMMARAAQILGEHGISIAAVIQKEARAGEYVPVIILTHEASESDFRAALSEIDGLDIVDAPTVRLRIEDHV